MNYPVHLKSQLKKDRSVFIQAYEIPEKIFKSYPMGGMNNGN